MISDKHFKIKRSTKTMIGLMHGSTEDKNQFKRMMIQAQLYEEAARRAALKSKDTSSNKATHVGGVAKETE